MTEISLLRPVELKILKDLVVKTKKLKGSMAEVGVYKGGSAKVICENKGLKHLYLFDTFEGIPYKEITEEYDLPRYPPRRFKHKLGLVKKVLRGHKNVHYCKGFFPLSSRRLPKIKFCFVHFDADLYKTTKDALEYFYPKMVEGGIILIHDYFLRNKECTELACKGVTLSVDKFMLNKPEQIQKLSAKQFMIEKT